MFAIDALTVSGIVVSLVITAGIFWHCTLRGCGGR